MFSFLSDEKKVFKKYNKLVEEINKKYNKLKDLSDNELLEKSKELRNICFGEKENEHITEAFAIAKEAAKRAIGLEAFDVQLMGGLILNDGKIAEMKTGEGKTLVAVFPAYYNAICTGKSIVITVNDYLAKRDATQMGQVYNFLGLSTGIIQHEMESEERQKEYKKDIVYVTNKEFGFDYLRDNRAYQLSDCIMPEFTFVLIDEVDSVLIDEARTPLIISNPINIKEEQFENCIRFLKQCEIGEIIDENEDASKLVKRIINEAAIETGDVIVDGEFKKVHLTEQGVTKAEKFFNVENWSSIDNSDLRAVMQQCMMAMYILIENKQYIVTKNKEGNDVIKLIDEFNGRISEGKEYSHGLQQAIQAKHGLEITSQSMAIAQITYPNLFRMAKKLAGMTGTAKTEENEFISLYGLSVKVVPTNKPMIRKDDEDRFFFSKEEKYNAILETVKEAIAIERPVLIGTPSIEVNESVAALLKDNGIQCEVLNAKYVEKEAEIIAKAGQKGSVTVATNMAGRGTDIIIDDYTRSVGGLLIIGVERHESRRIDNQLCGRAGRQGDPGESMFFISLEDDILKYFSIPPVLNKMRNSLDHSVEISLPIMSSIIDKAQKKIEGNNYRMRENLTKDDTVINQQRNIIYNDRNKILKEKDILVLLNIYTFQLYEEGVISETDKESVLKKLEQFSALDNRDYCEDVIRKAILIRIDKEWAEYLEGLEDIQTQILASSVTGCATDTDFMKKTADAFEILIEDIKENIIIAVNSLTEADFIKKTTDNDILEEKKE